MSVRTKLLLSLFMMINCFVGILSVHPALATPSIHDVRNTVKVLPLTLDQGKDIFIKKGETLKLYKLYHETGDVHSWNEYIAFEKCPTSTEICAVPFIDSNGHEYQLIDQLHFGIDALTTVGFYAVQNAQGKWSLLMIKMDRSLEETFSTKSETTAYVSLFELTGEQKDPLFLQNNSFQEIAALPMGRFCNSSVALDIFLGNPLPRGVSPDGCIDD